MEKNMVCIVCPVGCRMTVTVEDKKIEVAHNKCKRGEVYGTEEMTNPTRMITSTIKINDGLLRRLPVRTLQPVPKGMIFECMDIINNMAIDAPVKMGEVVIENICGTGVDIIATRSMERN